MLPRCVIKASITSPVISPDGVDTLIELVALATPAVFDATYVMAATAGHAMAIDEVKTRAATVRMRRFTCVALRRSRVCTMPSEEATGSALTLRQLPAETPLNAAVAPPTVCVTVQLALTPFEPTDPVPSAAVAME